MVSGRISIKEASAIVVFKASLEKRLDLRRIFDVTSINYGVVNGSGTHTKSLTAQTVDFKRKFYCRNPKESRVTGYKALIGYNI